MATAAAALWVGGSAWQSRQDDDPQGSARSHHTAPTSRDDVVMTVERQTTIFYVDGGTEPPRVFSAQRMIGGDTELEAVREAANPAQGGLLASSYWPSTVRIQNVRPPLDDDTIRITLSAPAHRLVGVTHEQALAQVTAIVRTAQAEYAEHDTRGALMSRPTVEFYAGDDRQAMVLGVDPDTVAPGRTRR
jgi:hypothetical protein